MKNRPPVFLATIYALGIVLGAPHLAAPARAATPAQQFDACIAPCGKARDLCVARLKRRGVPLPDIDAQCLPPLSKCTVSCQHRFH